MPWQVLENGRRHFACSKTATSEDIKTRTAFANMSAVRLEEGQEVLKEDAEKFILFNETQTCHYETGETCRTLSWIWLTTPSSSSDDEKDDILHSEWARSRERVAQGQEEAKWWRTREHVRDGVMKDLAEGLTSYAQAQAMLQDDLAAHFRQL
ncbi:hypothetical protein BDZ97DRAFT_1769924 [Flammula alnicola]|nr:hypothetical protein BDZ97DRAFT_1769924 [Flammula alnicola]